MEDDFGVELSEVLDVINTAEVFVVMFQMFEKRLLVDARSSAADTPLIRVVDRARNSEERFRELVRMRPRFSAPDRIIAFQWPRSVRTFVDAGVWAAVQRRVMEGGTSENTCLAVLSDLQWQERNEQFKAVRGEEPYHTMNGSNIT